MHLDITDGYFTPIVSWNTVEDIRFLDGKSKIEIHLMVEKPEEIVSDWAEVADRIIIHQEATENLQEIIDSFTSSVIKIGVALLLPTPVETLALDLSKISFVQLMSIAEIGEQSHPFDDRVLEKIKPLRALQSGVTIQIDGGVNGKSAPLLVKAGAHRLAAGSYILRSKDPQRTIHELEHLPS